MTGGYNAGSCMIQVAKDGDKFAAKELWKSPEVGSHIQNAVFWKDCIYLNSDNKGGGMVCLGLDGKVKWRSKEKFDKGNLVIADGAIYIIEGKSPKGGKAALRIVAADPAGYKELASAGVMEGEMIWAPMALSDGKLIVRDQKQTKCLDISGK
jgi:outer membrane protein assembly factor BamB